METSAEAEPVLEESIYVNLVLPRSLPAPETGMPSELPSTTVLCEPLIPDGTEQLPFAMDLVAISPAAEQPSPSASPGVADTSAATSLQLTLSGADQRQKPVPPKRTRPSKVPSSLLQHEQLPQPQSSSCCQTADATGTAAPTFASASPHTAEASVFAFHDVSTAMSLSARTNDDCTYNAIGSSPPDGGVSPNRSAEEVNLTAAVPLYSSLTKKKPIGLTGLPESARLLAAVLTSRSNGACAQGLEGSPTSPLVISSSSAASSPTAQSPAAPPIVPACTADRERCATEKEPAPVHATGDEEDTVFALPSLTKIPQENESSLSQNNEVLYEEIEYSSDSSSECQAMCEMSQESRGMVEKDDGYVGLRPDFGEYVSLSKDSPDASATSQPSAMSANATTKQLVRRGMLFKQGGQQNNKGWRKRYVTFDGKNMRYYANEKSRASKKIIAVTAMRNVQNNIKDSDKDWFRFSLRCVDRTYLFASEKRDDCLLWTSVLMKAIIQSTKEAISSVFGGPEMCQPDHSGFVKIDGKAKQFVAVKKGKLCYYRLYEDFMIACPIHQIDMEVASVKEDGKLKLQLCTPYHQYTFACDSEEDARIWKTALEDSIVSALSENEALEKIYKNESNRYCADCRARNPDWAVLHLLITVCRNCAGVHRQYWASKVKSLKMDQKIWTSSLEQLFACYGNAKANYLWERKLPPDNRKPKDSSDVHARQSYFVNKYQRKAYFDSHPLFGDQEALDKALCECVQREDGLVESVQLIHSGANIRKTLDCSEGAPTVMELAQRSCQWTQVEMLRQLGSDDSVYCRPSDIGSIVPLKEASAVVQTGFVEEISKKETFRWWAVLDTTRLSLFTDERAAVAKTTISLADVQFISLQQNTDSNNRSTTQLCIRVASGDNDKLLTLCASSSEEVSAWTRSMYQVLCDGFHKDLPEKFDIAGYLFTKEGGQTVWQNSWACLNGKQLFFCNISLTGNHEIIDIRKLTKVNFAMQDSTDCPAFESSPSLIVSLPNRVIYLQSNFRHDTRAWASAIEKNHKDVSKSLEDQLLTKDDVLVVVDKCVAFVSTHGMEMEGVYRLSATNSAVSRLVDMLSQDAWSVQLLPGSYSVHEVANACKRYLRNLSDPMMMKDLYSHWFEARAIADECDRVAAYKVLLGKLPTVNYATLKLLLGHLQRVAAHEAENKMNINNLATVFGPVLMTSPNGDFSQTNLEIATVTDLITMYHLIFEVDQSVIDKDRLMEKLIKDIQEGRLATAQQQSSSDAVLSHLLLHVYIGDIYGQCISIDVGAELNASQVVELVYDARPQAFAGSASASGSKSSSSTIKAEDLSLYEVIGDRELERPLGDTELVLEAVKRWPALPEELNRNNYLSVKKNLIEPNFSSLVGADMARVTELQCYLTSGWKKFYCEIANATLTFYKDSKLKTQAASFCIRDMIVYLGVEKKRKPPTKNGFTFFMKADFANTPVQRSPVTGHGVCFGSDNELTTWLSAIDWAQRFSVRPDKQSASLGAEGSSYNSGGLTSPNTEKKEGVLMHAFKSLQGLIRS